MSEVLTLARELEKARGEQALRFAELKNADASQKMGIAESIKSAEADLGALHDKWVAARELEAIESRNNEELKNLKSTDRKVAFGNGGDDLHNDRDGRQKAAFKSIGEAFTASDAYKSNRNDSHAQYGVSVEGMTLTDAIKATLTTTAGITPYPPQQADVVPFARRRPTVADLMPQTDTDAPSIIYLEQTTATNGSDTVAEGGTKPESEFVWTRRTIPLEVIAHLLPVTNQQLEDVPAIRAIIDQELVELLRLTEEDQILNGSGTSPDLTGIMTKTGVQTQAKGSDDIFTAAMKAFTLVRHTGFADVTAGVLHPNDWLAYATAQDSTGRFIYGSPSEAVTPRLWGVPIVVTTAATENTGLFGDFSMYTRLWRKGGIRVEVGYNGTDFAKNMQTIRCEERVALQIRRAAAFVKLTGI
jgi:HK97 family phage major capsid protein